MGFVGGACSGSEVVGVKNEGHGGEGALGGKEVVD